MTRLQTLGDWGEEQVTTHVRCQVCHSDRLSRLVSGFPSLDLVCKNCGAYMAQVKTVSVAAASPQRRPVTIRGAGWNPLQIQISVGALRDLYVVGALADAKSWRLQWIDRVPGAALLANAHVYVKRIAEIHGGRRKHLMFDLKYSEIPEACVMNVYSADQMTGAH